VPEDGAGFFALWQEKETAKNEPFNIFFIPV